MKNNIKELWWSETYSAPYYTRNDDNGQRHNGTREIMDDVYDYIWEMTDGMETEDIPDKIWLGHVNEYLQHYCISNEIKYLGLQKI